MSGTFRLLSVMSAKRVAIARAAKTKMVFVQNVSAGGLWLHVYDALTADIVIATTTPTWTFPVAADGGGFSLPILELRSGLVFRVTTVEDFTSVVDAAAGDVTINGQYH